MRERSNRLNSQASRWSGRVAVLLLWSSVEVACVFPQDDQIIPLLPGPANRPLRVLRDLALPEGRETTVKLGTNCTRVPFSIGVEDPDPDQEIGARWFVDPNERYVADTMSPAAVDGNAGVLVQQGSLVRRVTANMQFMNLLSGFADGRVHRVEVVVTDGRFQEAEREDRDGVVKPFLEVVPRGTVRGPSGEVLPGTAYRDEYLWLVEVDSLPCR